MTYRAKQADKALGAKVEHGAEVTLGAFPLLELRQTTAQKGVCLGIVGRGILGHEHFGRGVDGRELRAFRIPRKLHKYETHPDFVSVRPLFALAYIRIFVAGVVKDIIDNLGEVLQRRGHVGGVAHDGQRVAPVRRVGLDQLQSQHKERVQTLVERLELGLVCGLVEGLLNKLHVLLAAVFEECIDKAPFAMLKQAMRHRGVIQRGHALLDRCLGPAVLLHKGQGRFEQGLRGLCRVASNQREWQSGYTQQSYLHKSLRMARGHGHAPCTGSCSKSSQGAEHYYLLL